MAQKYYAVKKGKVPGIYYSWEDCKEQVSGFKGAVYKSFQSQEEARRYYESSTSKSSIVNSAKEIVSAYVDGSFASGQEFGSGCVLIYQNEIIKRISKKFEDEELASMRNVAGEIKAAELAIQFAIDNHYDGIVIYHDYEGIARWAKGEWKTNKEGTKAYKKWIDEIRDKIIIEFVKVKGHSGDEYNEMADCLAKKAIGLC